MQNKPGALIKRMLARSHLDTAEMMDTADDHIAGELDPEAKAYWDEHLQDCERCRAYIAYMSGETEELPPVAVELGVTKA